MEMEEKEVEVEMEDSMAEVMDSRKVLGCRSVQPLLFGRNRPRPCVLRDHRCTSSLLDLV